MYEDEEARITNEMYPLAGMDTWGAENVIPISDLAVPSIDDWTLLATVAVEVPAELVT